GFTNKPDIRHASHHPRQSPARGPLVINDYCAHHGLRIDHRNSAGSRDAERYRRTLPGVAVEPELVRGAIERSETARDVLQPRAVRRRTLAADTIVADGDDDLAVPTNRRHINSAGFLARNRPMTNGVLDEGLDAQHRHTQRVSLEVDARVVDQALLES